MPWRCHRPDRDSCRGSGIARGVRPLISPSRLDPGCLASPFRVQQLLDIAAETVVDGLQDGLHREPVLAGNFFWRKRFWANGFAVKDFRPDPPMHEQLAVVRARFWLQVFVLNSLNHVLFLDEYPFPMVAQGDA